MRDLRLTLLGPFDCRTRAGGLVAFPTRKARALCAYLGLSAGKRHARDELATMFWGDQPEGEARANLRSTLSRLRGALPAEIRAAVVTDRDCVTLCAETCRGLIVTQSGFNLTGTAFYLGNVGLGRDEMYQKTTRLLAAFVLIASLSACSQEVADPQADPAVGTDSTTEGAKVTDQGALYAVGFLLGLALALL